MMRKGVRGVVIAVMFVFALVASHALVLRQIPASWTESFVPPFNVLITLVPIVVLTFFAARQIPLNAIPFGLLAFVVTFVTLAFVFEFRGIDDSLDVPFIFAAVYAIAFLVGFVGNRLQHHRARNEQGL